MNIWQKKLNKEISFKHLLIILIIFFFLSTLIIYYSATTSPAESFDVKINKQLSTSYKQQSSYLKIYSPKAYSNIKNNFILAGSANLKTNKLSYRLINKQQETLLQGNIILEKINQQNDFNLEINFTPGLTKTSGAIEFYILDSLNKEMLLLSIPLNFN